MVGIVILNYNCAKLSIECIENIRANTALKYKIYLVDNNSVDDSFSVLKNYADGFSDTTLIQAEKNGGYSYGNNLGIKVALEDECENLVIINPDVVVEKNAIDIMIDTLNKNENVAVVGPKVITNGKPLIYAKKGITLKQYLWTRKPLAFLNFNRTNKKLHYKLNLDATAVFDGMVGGCCFAIKSSVMAEIGLFDDNMFLYFEEDALWSRFSRLNYLSAIEPNAVVYHMHSGTIGDMKKPFACRCREYSAIYYLKTYRGLKGLKLRFAIFYAKMFFVLVQKKNKFDYKSQYKILKTDLAKLKGDK